MQSHSSTQEITVLALQTQFEHIWNMEREAGKTINRNMATCEAIVPGIVLLRTPEKWFTQLKDLVENTPNIFAVPDDATKEIKQAVEWNRINWGRQGLGGGKEDCISSVFCFAGGFKPYGTYMRTFWNYSPGILLVRTSRGGKLNISFWHRAGADDTEIHIRRLELPQLEDLTELPTKNVWVDDSEVTKKIPISAEFTRDSFVVSVPHHGYHEFHPIFVGGFSYTLRGVEVELLPQESTEIAGYRSSWFVYQCWNPFTRDEAIQSPSRSSLHDSNERIQWKSLCPAHLPPVIPSVLSSSLSSSSLPLDGNSHPMDECWAIEYQAGTNYVSAVGLSIYSPPVVNKQLLIMLPFGLVVYPLNVPALYPEGSFAAGQAGSDVSEGISISSSSSTVIFRYRSTGSACKAAQPELRRDSTGRVKPSRTYSGRDLNEVLPIRSGCSGKLSGR
ncbi:hypothetical protein B0H11DRAFT_1927099 [Mycena galericulata]|nr:hypothetical protein B0H11DRAFT_1927099 [Mycena galericulata]